MDFTYDENQHMLHDSIDRFLTARYDLPTRRKLLTDKVANAALWRDMAELGWIGAAFPEEVGGFSTSPVDAMIVMDRFGRHLVTAPYLITAIICGRILIDGFVDERRRPLIEQIIGGELQLALAAGHSHLLHSPEHSAFIAERRSDGFIINGRMPVVLNGDRADKLIVAARTAGAGSDEMGITAFLVDANAVGISCKSFRMIDGHGAAEVIIDRLAVNKDAIVGEVDGGVSLINRALDYGIAGICGEALGSMAHLVFATAEYTRTREQYGMPLAKCQVLQHRMADMYIQTETARSMTYLASLSLESPIVACQQIVSAAKVQVGRSGKFVGYQAVQLHGGMGVSEELDIGHHYIRLVMINQLFGDQAYHLQRFADFVESPAIGKLNVA